jgi:hypothetical protein
MHSFEYASPATLKDALGLLGTSWSDAAVLAGGTDLISSMKDNLAAPKRVVNIKGTKELSGISKVKDGLRIGAAVTVDELMENALVRAEYRRSPPPRAWARRKSAIWAPSGRPLSAPALLVLSQRLRPAGDERRQEPRRKWPERVPRHLLQRPGQVRQRLQLRAGAYRAWREVENRQRVRQSRSRRRRFLQNARLGIGS